MGAIVLVDNLFNTRLYPGHTVSAEEEPTGQEAFRFAAGRRTQQASATTANSDWWIRADFTVVRAFDMVCLWNHNLAGKTLRIQASADSYTSIETIFDATLPTTPGAGDVDDSLGVLTESGMWIKRFPLRTNASVRLYSVAMGAGLKPLVNGLVGQSFDVGFVGYPYEPDADELAAVETVTDAGWVGRGPIASVRTGVLDIRLDTLEKGESFRRHARAYGVGAPMLIIPDEGQAERAFLAHRPVGRFGMAQTREWFFPTGKLPYRELEAA